MIDILHSVFVTAFVGSMLSRSLYDGRTCPLIEFLNTVQSSLYCRRHILRLISSRSLPPRMLRNRVAMRRENDFVIV